MTIKRTNNNGDSANGDGVPSESPAVVPALPQFRENSAVNGKIDAYIKDNPKEWAYIQGMPRDRLERSLVLQNVQREERKEKMRAGILRKLDENPELKEAYRTLVKNLPAQQQEKAILSLAMQTSRTVAPLAQQQQQQQSPPAQGARV